MVLRNAGLHVRSLSAGAASRRAERRRIAGKSLLSAALRASTQRRASTQVDPGAATHRQACCLLQHQPRVAPWPDHRTRQVPACIRAARSNSSVRFARSAASSEVPATEAGPQQPDADSDADSDGEAADLQEPASGPDARLDPGLYLVATPIGIKALHEALPPLQNHQGQRNRRKQCFRNFLGGRPGVGYLFKVTVTTGQISYSRAETPSQPVHGAGGGHFRQHWPYNRQCNEL